jgi:pimeloyl-ACP methyl ester carboxylesterase
MNDLSSVVPDGGLGVQAVALMDIGLRTALASLVATSAAPRVLIPKARPQERAALDFYAALGVGADAETIFVRPPADVKVRARRIGRLPWAPAVGHVDLLSFKSPYRVRYPAVRQAYAGHKRNAMARAQHWRHEDEPRPTIIVVHGFAGSPYWFNSSFFSLPWFYGHGCDMLLVTLPFHGARNDRGAPYSGSGLFSNGMATLTEAMLQSICDIRVIVDYLAKSGVDNVGITGLSLGGYLTALMAAVEPRLHVAIPNSAVTDIAGLVDSWFPANALLKLGFDKAGISQSEYRAAVGLHSPLRYPPVLERDRLFVIGGLGDRLAPPEQSARLWEHWGRPRIHWYPGSHILHVGRAHYLREIGHFLKDTGFSPG